MAFISLNRYSLLSLARVLSPSLVSLKVTVPRVCASTVRSLTVSPCETTVNVSFSSADIPVTTLSNLPSNL